MLVFYYDSTIYKEWHIKYIFTIQVLIQKIVCNLPEFNKYIVRTSEYLPRSHSLHIQRMAWHCKCTFFAFLNGQIPICKFPHLLRFVISNSNYTDVVVIWRSVLCVKESGSSYILLVDFGQGNGLTFWFRKLVSFSIFSSFFFSDWALLWWGSGDFVGDLIVLNVSKKVLKW